MKYIQPKQAASILAVLQCAGLSFLPHRLDDGRWRVETSGGHCHEGESLVDALGQLTQTLTLDLDLALEDLDELCELDPDERRYTLEAPIEFCKRYVVLESEPPTECPTCGGSVPVPALVEMAQ